MKGNVNINRNTVTKRQAHRNTFWSLILNDGLMACAKLAHSYSTKSELLYTKQNAKLSMNPEAMYVCS